MIDWHSHILPEMDDGSRSIEESLQMLEALGEQGAQCVLATPHFFANEESVDEFLLRRSEAFGKLKDSLDGKYPCVLCGAEVRYYSGISKMQGLDRLTVDGTKILLLEMPMSKWTEYTLKELEDLAGTRGLTVVMAHIERYMALQGERTFERLCDCGILMQVNASFFEGFRRHKALKLLGNGKIHFIGSDTHNMTSRAPKLDVAYGQIHRKFGEDFVFQMNEFGKSALGHNI